MLAEVIADLAPQFGARVPLVIPVPLHSSRLRQRGFNHSELIARAALIHLSRAHSLSAAPVLAPEVLIRRRATQSQTGLTQSQRRANIRSAFQVTDRAAVKDCDVLLVDDVYTTGTTAGECARVLRKAGCARVWVVTVARVLKTGTQLENGHESLVMAAKSG
jgi:ComF family protein